MRQLFTLLGALMLPLLIFQGVSGKDLPESTPPKKAISRSVYYDVPDGYTQVGNTDLYYRPNSGSIDVVGKFGSQYYSSTFSDGGYRLAIQVGDNYPTSVDCFYGTSIDGVTCNATVVPQGEFARIVYTVTNSTDNEISVSLGTHADVMIGNNDHAPISRRKDTYDNTYGLTLRDGNGAELCVLFGSGLVGVNGVDDFWFGHYAQNNNEYAMVGNYTSGSNYMEENGSYDSGMGWCWKNRTVPAHSSVEFSYLIGVGDVNLEPNSTFAVTPDDPDGWNDISLPHCLTLKGDYESPAGQNGIVQYAVEDAQEWIDLTEELESGSSFTASLVVMFDPDRDTHQIRLRIMDAVGNTTLLSPIVYKDVRYHTVSGIENKTYNWGDSIYQTNLICDLPDEEYQITAYRNNQNAGIATFYIEGVFPHSIGRKSYSFAIDPIPLTGQISLEQEQFVYSGEPFYPNWSFTDDIYNSLSEGEDYVVLWSDNIRPGSAELRITGKGNFSNELASNFYIDKAQLTENLYSIILPEEDVTADGSQHGASVSVDEGAGMPIVYYTLSEQESLTEIAPADAGSYDIYVEITDGELYYGKAREKVFSFTIYNFDENDWAVLQTIYPALTARGWSAPWDLSGGIASAAHLPGLKIRHGRVVGLDLPNESLSGVFPGELLAFPMLNSLNLSGNNFDGPIESVAAYVQQNPGVGATLAELNISDNTFSGNLGLMAACFPNLTSIDASGNCLSDVYPKISEYVVHLNISGQTIDRTIEYDLSNSSMEELAQQIPTILVYDHINQSYTKPLNLQLSMEDGFGMTISYTNGHIGISNVSEQNAYHGENGGLLNVTALNTNDSEALGTLKLKLMFDSGDANFDGNVNILDLQTAILYIFERYSYLPFNFTAANLWIDEYVNVQDIVCYVNLLMSSGDESYQQKPGSWSDGYRQHMSDQARIYVENGMLMLDTSEPVAAFDITVGTAEGIEIQNTMDVRGMTVNVRELPGGYRIIGYSLSGNCLMPGVTAIAAVDESASVRNAMLSDNEANMICVSFVGSTATTEMNTVSSDENPTLYDLHGRKVTDESRKGIFIRKDKKILR